MSLAVVAMMGILLVFLLVVGFCMADQKELSSELHHDVVQLKTARRRKRAVVRRRINARRKAA